MHKHKLGKKGHHHHHKHGLKHKACLSKQTRRGGHHGKFIAGAPFLHLREADASSHLRETGLPPTSVGRGPGTAIIPRIDLQRCKVCGKCQRVCPSSAIRVEHDIARINERLCTGCGACIDACPTGALVF